MVFAGGGLRFGCDFHSPLWLTTFRSVRLSGLIGTKKLYLSAAILWFMCCGNTLVLSQCHLNASCRDGEADLLALRGLVASLDDRAVGRCKLER